MCIKKKNETATISTLTYSGLNICPIVMVVPSYRRNIDNFILMSGSKNVYVFCNII